jgi:ribosomal protein L44E
MGRKYCPECREVTEIKVLGDYSQVELRGIAAKRRRIKHMEEDGGCGCEWFTVEMPEEFLLVSRED